MGKPELVWAIRNSLTILEAAYILVLRSFSNEIFAAISLVIGTILGAFFGQRG